MTEQIPIGSVWRSLSTRRLWKVLALHPNGSVTLGTRPWGSDQFTVDGSHLLGCYVQE